MQKLIAIMKTSLTFKIIVGLILFYFLFAYFAINPIAIRAIPWFAEKHLASRASVNAVKFDPLTLTLTAKDFKLSTSTGETLSSFEQLLIDFEVNGLLDWAWKFKTIHLNKPFINVGINQTGKLNWAELVNAFNQNEKAQSSGQLPRVILDQISINQGHLQYNDAHRTQALRFDITPLDFSVNGISTLPNDGGEYLISAKLPEQEGEIRWKGNISLNPLASKGKLNLHHIDLPKVLELAKNLSLPITLEEGVLDIVSDYDFSIEEIKQTEADLKAGKAPTPPKTNVVLNNVMFTLNALKGMLVNEQTLLTEKLEVTSSAILIDMQQTKTTMVETTVEGLAEETLNTNVVINTLDLSLDGFASGLSSNHAISSEKLSIKVPQVDIHIKEQADVSFESLSAMIDQFKFNQTNQALDTNFTLPHLALNEVSFKLADNLLLAEQLSLENSLFQTTADSKKMLFVPLAQANTISYDLAKNQLIVKDVQFNQGEVNTFKSKQGLINWAQAFSSQSAPIVKSESNNKTVEVVELGRENHSVVQPVKNEIAIVNSEKSSPVSRETNNIMSADVPTASETQASKEETVVAQTPSFTMEIANIQLNDWKTRYQDESFIHPLSVDVKKFDIGLALKLTEEGALVEQLSSQLQSISAVSSLSAQPVATIDTLTLSPSKFDIAKQSVSLPLLNASGLTTSVIQEKGKPLNWSAILAQKVLSTTQPAKVVRSTSTEDKSWQFALNQFKLANSQIHVEDHTPKQPLILDIQNANLNVKNISQKLSNLLPVNLDLKIKQGGSLHVNAKVTPSPFKTDLSLKLDRFSLKPISPYLNELAFLKLNNGSVSIDGQLFVKDEPSIATGFTMATGFKGAVSIDQLNIVEEVEDKPFLAWDSLRTKNLNFTSAPYLLNIDSLELIKPDSKFIIYEDKTTNISRILRSQTSGQDQVKDDAVYPTPEQSAKPTSKQGEVTQETIVQSESNESFPVRIAKTRIEDGSLEFADLALQLKFGTQIQKLKGIIHQISTDPDATSQVELNGQVDEYGVATINGAIKPFNAKDFTDMKLNFKNIEMNRLTPYSGEFAGRKIKSGKMTVALVYNIKDHQLDGKNKFIINKLELGEKIKSPNAADLPLDFAIAILEDNNGVIDLDLPVSGSLDDPKFSIGGIVWKAFANIMTKIVTAPFKVLGNLLGGGDKDLAAVIFEPALATITPPELEKLHTLSDMLKKRDSLTLTISPHFNKAKDTRALQEIQLRQKVSEALGITVKQGDEPEPMDLKSEETQKIIQALYDEMTDKSFYNKMKDKLKEPEAGHYEKLKEALIVGAEISDEMLENLAINRAQAIKKTLEEDGVNPAHISLKKPSASDAEVIEATFAIGAEGLVNSVKDMPAHSPT
jgi:hypothetical protein